MAQALPQASDVKLQVNPRILALAQRDGDGCVWCTEQVDLLEATVEHLVPRARGGPDHLDNLLLACRRCNPARSITPAVTYLDHLVAAGGCPQAALVEAALARVWASAAFSVGAHAVLERCYVAGVKALDDLEAALEGEGWSLLASPLAIGEHYLVARLRALADLEKAHKRVKDMHERGLSRRDFAVQVACNLETHHSRAAFHLLDDKEDEAFEMLLFRRLRRAFGRELERAFAPA